MILVCPKCSKAYQVVCYDPKDLEVFNRKEWSNSFPCVTPLCRGRMKRMDGYWSPGFDYHDVPANVMYRALRGFGPPEETDPASLARAREILLSEKIAELRAWETGNPTRVIIDMIIMESGTRLHFATSGKGACLYYIEENADADTP